MILWTSRASHTYILLILIFCSYEKGTFWDSLNFWFAELRGFREGAERATSNRNSLEIFSDTPLFLKGTPHSTADTPFFECDTPQKSKIHPKNCCFEVGSFSINFFVATQNDARLIVTGFFVFGAGSTTLTFAPQTKSCFAFGECCTRTKLSGRHYCCPLFIFWGKNELKRHKFRIFATF